MKQSVIDIDDFKVTIKEVTPRDAKNIVANIKEIFGDPNLDMMKFIDEKYDLVVGITKNFIVLPPEKHLDELAFSDIDLIADEFKKVNESFLGKMVWLDVLKPSEIALKEKLKKP